MSDTTLEREQEGESKTEPEKQRQSAESESTRERERERERQSLKERKFLISAKNAAGENNDRPNDPGTKM